MAEISKMPKLRILMFSALIAAGVLQLNNTVLAADGNVSERDMLDQAVALFEKLSGESIDVPDGLMGISDDLFLDKSVILGFINADEIQNVSQGVSVRKQDAMTVLYKTIINFDDSYALSTQEVDEIMNSCVDNALIDEENRVGYAFMIKHGVIENNAQTDPDSEITWSSCSLLVDMLYDMFMQDISFSVSDGEIKIGSNIDTVIDVFGEPDRIDESEYGYKWYVYNSDYARFMMVGVSEDRVCAFYTNSGDFSVGNTKSGDDYAGVYEHYDNSCINFYEDSDGKIDAVFYNPYAKSDDSTKLGTKDRSYQFVDLINAKRVKNGLKPVYISEELWKNANDIAGQPKYIALAQGSDEYTKNDNELCEAGFDVFSVYSELVKSNSSLLDDESYVIGAGTSVTADSTVCVSVVVSDEEDKGLSTSSDDIVKLAALTDADDEEKNESSDEKAETEYVSYESTDGEDAQEVDSDAVEMVAVETVNLEKSVDSGVEAETESDTESEGIVVSPVNEQEIKDGEDLILKLSENSADEYHVKIYSFEDDDFIVDSYIRTNGNEIVFDSELFTGGKDYQVEISTVAETDTNVSESFVIRYGTAENIELLQNEDYSTDNDYIDLEWKSDIYHDFVIDIYDSEGKLVLSKDVLNSNEAKAINVSPGDYFVYVSAVRRGDREVIKSQDSVKVTVTLPEPVITEYILEDGEKFYPVYEDKEMGVVYFYDEEITDVKETTSSGKTKTVKKKKITEKQVKATSYYKQLSAAQPKVEYFTGSSVLDTPKTTGTLSAFSSQFKGSISLEGDITVGQAIVEEAKKYLGVPYVWGGTTPSGFDCSGLVQYVCKTLGIDVSRVSQDQYYDGIPVSREDLQPGDLVFFQNDGDVHHVGIYVGNGMMIHAPYTGEVVKYQSIDTPYYASEFCGGRRVY